MAVDSILPWNLGVSVSLLLMFAGMGFHKRWNISNIVENRPGSSPVTFHITKRRFVNRTVGRWWSPLYIGSKLSHHSLVGGRYTYANNEIDINLPVVAKMAENDGFPSVTLEEAVIDVVEHEAIHSAIHSHAEPIYQQLEQVFRNQFRDASLAEKAKMYLLSLPYHWGSNNWEEYAIEQLQDQRRALRDFKETSGETQ